MFDYVKPASPARSQPSSQPESSKGFCDNRSAHAWGEQLAAGGLQVDRPNHSSVPNKPWEPIGKRQGRATCARQATNWPTKPLIKPWLTENMTSNPTILNWFILMPPINILMPVLNRKDYSLSVEYKMSMPCFFKMLIPYLRFSWVDESRFDGFRRASLHVFRFSRFEPLQKNVPKVDFTLYLVEFA